MLKVVLRTDSHIVTIQMTKFQLVKLVGMSFVPALSSKKKISVISSELAEKLLEFPEVKAEILAIRANRPSSKMGGVLEVTHV
jgi:hypothetical protein